MERKSSISRWLVILWLLASQTAGAAMAFASALVVISFRGLGQQDANPMAFNILLALGYIMPIVFIALVIWAWVTFFKRKDGTAALLGLASLIPGVIMQFGMRLYAP
ncbi:MAG TPA: hypothetical protein DEP19_05595 [Anaerolineae bacterium]|nr:hypothetical protein [Anaerolineae bacterium]HCK65297.1 hypothetical protein [Anaerolineae bacterium]